jgi:hypothetical protein
MLYYLALHFEDNKDRLKWSSPLERAIYAIGIISVLWIFSIWEIVELITTKSIPFQSINPTLFTVITIAIGLGIMQFYSYIYITKNRYMKISNSEFRSSINIRRGKILALGIGMFSFALPFAIFMIFT